MLLALHFLMSELNACYEILKQTLSRKEIDLIFSHSLWNRNASIFVFLLLLDEKQIPRRAWLEWHQSTSAVAVSRPCCDSDLFLKDNKCRCLLYPLIAADGQRRWEKKWVKKKHERANQHFISATEWTHAPSPSLLHFPQIYHVLPDPVCVVDREVTRAMEAEGERSD